jgi:flagellar FliL protein
MPVAEEEVQVQAMPQKKSGFKLIVLSVVAFLVVLVCATVLVVVLAPRRGELSIKHPEAKVAKPKPGFLVPLNEDIIVNLAEERGRRFLKVNAVIELDKAKTAEELELRLPQVRDLIIGILRQKTVEKISEKEGINQVRSEIITGINTCLSAGEVINLYFTNFVIQ